MTIGSDQLDYGHHLRFYQGLGNLSGDPAKDAYWHRQAEYLHVLSVCDAIRDTHLDAVRLGYQATSSEARLQLHHGVGRRTKFIWLSLWHLLSLVRPDRTEPLPLDDVEQAAQDLNSIYINIRGVFDNFAWCVLDLFAEEKTRDLAKNAPAKVNLFSLKDPNLRDVAKFMNTFDEWNKKLKDRRDPAAHRIPLSLPPALLDGKARKKYIEIRNEWETASKAAIEAVRNSIDSSALFEKTEALGRELERIGTFRPLFVHHPDKGATEIYPTVPEDIGKVVKIARGLSAIILSRLST